MKIDFMEFLKETLEAPENLNADQIGKLLLETKSYFSSLEKVMGSNDMKAKEEAMAAAFELRDFLEVKANQFAPFIGTALKAEEKNLIDEGLNGIGKREKHTNKIKPIKMS